MQKSQVLIVGGGIAGLSCAHHLHHAGIPFQLLEASDRVGGRVRTDVCEGFQLDRGFQVLLTAYPEAQALLDYKALQLGKFEPGALIRFQGKFRRFADPLRRPRHLLHTALSPVATFPDKLRMGLLQRQVCRNDLESLNQRPEISTLNRLQEIGFSSRVIDRFFRPFLGGVFLESGLTTSSRKFEFVFRMFSTGEAALPAAGMGAIATQLASGLPTDWIRTGTRVKRVSPQQVWLEDGQVIQALRVVLACDQPSAAKLLGKPSSVQGHPVTCLYFSAAKPPVEEPILVLNGDGHGPVNNLCVPSQVIPGYAPPGKSLVSVTVLGEAGPDRQQNLVEEVRAQLIQWFGSDVADWVHLKTMHIPFGLPIQNAGGQTADEDQKPPEHDGLIECGDHLENASLQGAMLSGRRAAESIIAARSNGIPKSGQEPLSETRSRR